MEFGFRKSFPAVVAEACHELVAHHGVHPHSALWLGAGSGRGPFILSRKFKNVRVPCIELPAVGVIFINFVYTMHYN